MNRTDAQDSVRRIFNLVDSIISTLDELSEGKSLSSVWDNLRIDKIGRRVGGIDSINFSADPFNILLLLMKRFCDKDTLIEFLSNTIVYELPALELAVKMALIASLKQMVDCNTDPMIPDRFRMKLNTSPLVFGEEELKRGGFIDVASIDKSGILDLSPISEAGQFAYFGTKHYYTVEYNDISLMEKGGFEQGGTKKKFYKYVDAVNAARKISDTVKRIELDQLNATSPLGGNMINVGAPSNLVKEYQDVNTIWELARAEDFNAFLWFVEKKACFISPINLGEEIKNYSAGTQAVFANNATANNTVLNALLAEYSGNTSQYYELGDIFIQQSGGTNSTVLSLCIKEDIINGKTYSTIVPATCDYTSANWYVNRRNYFTKGLSELVGKYDDDYVRDYEKEFALLNVRYSGVINGSNGSSRGTFQAQIMPKPFTHIAQNVEYWGHDEDGKKVKKYSGFGGMSIPMPIKLLFKSNGVSTKGMGNGKYTVKVKNSKPEFKEETGWYYYDIVYGNESKTPSPYRIRVNSLLQYEIIYEKKGLYRKKNKDGKEVSWEYMQDVPMTLWLPSDFDNFKKSLPFILHECYPGLTVYEFNYDFIMGMRLYDSKVIVSKLLDICTNLSAGLRVSKYLEYDIRIAKIVENIISSYDSAVSDCFYTFSNEQYDSMIQESEMRRSQNYNFNNSSNSSNTVDLSSIYSQLSELGSTDLSGDSAILTRAINDASVEVSEGAEPKEKFNIESNFVGELINALTSVLVTAILTPKVLFILNFNKQIAEGIGSVSGGCNDVECIMKDLGHIIVSVVKKIINYLLFQMEEFVVKRIGMMLLKLGEKIVAEQLEWYALFIKDLISNCVILPSKAPLLDTALDAVNYADITDANNNIILTEC